MIIFGKILLNMDFICHSKEDIEKLYAEVIRLRKLEVLWNEFLEDK
jgi:hypothetical protein